MAAEPLFTEIARPKVNLTLHVTGRRDDGYHLLESAVVFADTGDVVQVGPAETLDLSYDGPFADALPPPGENLVFKAAARLQDTFAIDAGAAIRLTKTLPVASGIGGGSADAAAAIRALCRLWGIDGTSPRLMDLALSLGADVPVCLASTPAMMRGIGEMLSPLPPLPDMAILLVNPGVAVSTPSVFKARTGPFSKAGGWPAATTAPDDVFAAAQARQNDLEAPAIALAPVIGDVLRMLRETPGIGLARMSGSGATCFGLYARPADAQSAKTDLMRRQPGWWAEAAPLGTVNY